MSVEISQLLGLIRDLAEETAEIKGGCADGGNFYTSASWRSKLYAISERAETLLAVEAEGHDS